MEVSFYLRKELKNQKGYMPIRMHITVDGSLIKKSIKEVKVLPIHWKKDKQRVKPNTKNESYNFHIEYNQILDQLSDKVKNIERTALLNNIPLTKEYVLKKLDEKPSLSPDNDFFKYFEEFIKLGKGILAERTIKGYRTVYNFLKSFEESADIKLSMQEIDLITFDKLKSYAFQDRGILNNYFSKIVNVLKRFLTWAYDRNYHSNTVYHKFSAPEDNIEVIFLTLEELFRLYNYQFNSPKLEKVRDTYCFGCFTGLRFSDISNLRSSNIYSDHIKLNIKKTREIDHNIPLNIFSKQILDKYKSTPFEPVPVISSQKYNKSIKECCRIAGIDTPIRISRFSGSEQIDETFPKYDLIASHTARKTFITNSLILGMNERVVRSISGHKKEKSFNKYVYTADEHKKKQMENTWDTIKNS